MILIAIYLQATVATKRFQFGCRFIKDFLVLFVQFTSPFHPITTGIVLSPSAIIHRIQCKTLSSGYVITWVMVFKRELKILVFTGKIALWQICDPALIFKLTDLWHCRASHEVATACNRPNRKSKSTKGDLCPAFYQTVQKWEIYVFSSKINWCLFPQVIIRTNALIFSVIFLF